LRGCFCYVPSQVLGDVRAQLGSYATGEKHAAVKYLTDHYHEAPVWIIACLEDGQNPDRKAGSSIYPAVQNMSGQRGREWSE
jgi:hypothetical protein